MNSKTEKTSKIFLKDIPKHTKNNSDSPSSSIRENAAYIFFLYSFTVVRYNLERFMYPLLNSPNGNILKK